MKLESMDNKEIRNKRPKVEPIPVPDVPSLAPFLAEPRFTRENLQNLSTESSKSAWRGFLSKLGIEIHSGRIAEKRDYESGAFLLEIALKNGEEEGKIVPLRIGIGKAWLEIDASAGGLIPEAMLASIDPKLTVYKAVERVRVGLNGSISLLGNPSSLASVG